MLVVAIILIIDYIAVIAVAVKYRALFDSTKKQASVGIFMIITAGVIGVFGMARIVQGQWGGLAYYGAIFSIMILTPPICKIMKMEYLNALDFAAPLQSLSLAIMKITCIINGCCSGIVLFQKSNGELVFFPSQIVECVTAFLIFIVLMNYQKKSKFKGQIACLYMIIYGITRAIFELLRKDTITFSPYITYTSKGMFWCIVTIILGIILYIYLSNKETMKKIVQAKQEKL